MTISSTEKLFNEIALFITESRMLLEQGATVDLVGLDEQVRGLCEAVLQLSQDERITYADRLQSLLGGLKELGESIVVQRDKLAGLPPFKKADSAYRAFGAASGDNDNDEEEDE